MCRCRQRYVDLGINTNFFLLLRCIYYLFLIHVLLFQSKLIFYATFDAGSQRFAMMLALGKIYIFNQISASSGFFFFL
jgi:hypothetical protein